MPRRPLKCFTKTANDGHTYTTCLEGQAKQTQSKAPQSKKKKPKFNVKGALPPYVAPKTKRKIKFNVINLVPKKKRPKFKVKKILPTELMGQFGLTNKEANAMSPEELFGQLPQELRALILSPKTTGIKVARGISDEHYNKLNTIVESILDDEGFSSYLYGWSFYSDGNFGERSSEFWAKKSEQVRNGSNLRELFVKLMEERPLLWRAVVLASKGKNSEISGIIDKDGALDEQGFINYDWEEYYPEQAYRLIYEDGEYNMSNRTRSTTNTKVKEWKEGMKKEEKSAKELFKTLRKEWR